MTSGIQPEATRIDSARINEIIVNGGIARKAAPHRAILAPGVQSYRQWIRNDTTALRTTLDPDSSRYRSQFRYDFVDHAVPYNIDGLKYGKFELARINRGIIPYDQQQADLAAYFMQADDRIFFAGDPLTPAGGSTGLANTALAAAAVEGTHFAVEGATAMDFSTDVLMTQTLAAAIGQQADHFKDRMSDYSLILAVSPDLDDWINGYKNAATSERMKPEILNILSENGDGGAAVLRTSWLGATIDKLGSGNLPIKYTDGSLWCALMMFSETNPLYEVVETGLIVDEDLNGLGVLTANFTEGYLPMQYDPFSIIVDKSVNITPA